jgi:hypothetical protein
MSAISSISSGAGQILGRTMFIQLNTSTGIPLPLAVLDVVKDEMVEYSADVTDHPVESGPEVSDHIQLRNPTIRLKGVISNTPLDLSVALANVAAGALAAISSAQARSNLLNSGISEGVGIVGSALQGNAGNLAANAFSGAVDAVSRTILLNAFQSKTPFSVMTKRQRYDNVVINRLSFPRTEETGYALAFEIDIKQIRIVKALKVQKTQVAENVLSTASSSTNLGSQATQAASSQISSAVQNSPLSNISSITGKSPGFFA